MSWNPSLDAQLNSDVNNAMSQCDVQLPIIMDRTPAAALNLNGASSQIMRAKQLVEEGIGRIRRNTSTIVQTMDTLTNNAEQATHNVEGQKHDVDELKQKVSKAKELYELRKEQAMELKNKNVGTYHTSWLGLWRPLTDDSRMGLLVASIVFGLVACVLLAFFVYGVVSTSILPAKQYIGGVWGKRKYM